MVEVVVVGVEVLAVKRVWRSKHEKLVLRRMLEWTMEEDKGYQSNVKVTGIGGGCNVLGNLRVLWSKQYVVWKD